jgi:hypothetical protein
MKDEKKMKKEAREEEFKGCRMKKERCNLRDEG